MRSAPSGPEEPAEWGFVLLADNFAIRRMNFTSVSDSTHAPMTRHIFTLLRPNLAHSFAHGQERISVFFHFGSILNWTIAQWETSFGQKKLVFRGKTAPRVVARVSPIFQMSSMRCRWDLGLSGQLNHRSISHIRIKLYNTQPVVVWFFTLVYVSLL